MRILSQKKFSRVTPEEMCRGECEKLGNSDCCQIELKAFFGKKNVSFLNKKFGFFYFLFVWRFLDTFPRGQGVFTPENVFITKT